jgi:hypothetical protein
MEANLSQLFTTTLGSPHNHSTPPATQALAQMPEREKENEQIFFFFFCLAVIGCLRALSFLLIFCHQQGGNPKGLPIRKAAVFAGV